MLRIEKPVKMAKNANENFAVVVIFDMTLTAFKNETKTKITQLIIHRYVKLHGKSEKNTPKIVCTVVDYQQGP